MNKRAFFPLIFALLGGLFLVELFIHPLMQPTAVSATTIFSPTAVSIQNSTATQLQFTLHTATAVHTDGLVQVEGLDQHLQIAGEPALPYYSTWIALPPNGTAVVDVKTNNVQTVDNTAVSPAIAEQPDLAAWAMLNGEPVPEQPASDDLQTRNASVYQQNKLYPAVTYALSEPMHQRDLRLVELRLYPLRYNPAAGELEQAGQMEVTVSFVGASAEGVDKRPFTIDSPLADQILNYEQSKAWRHFPMAKTAVSQLPIGQQTFKISLDKDGLYDITPAQLGSINPQAIEMMYRGEAVAYDIINDNGDTVFDANERIRFYGWAFDSLSIGNRFTETQFVNDNVYWLWANGNPTRVVHETSTNSHPTATTFPETLTFAPENIFFSTWTSDWTYENEQDAWYWELVEQTSDVLTQTYAITLPHPANNGSIITYTTELLSREYPLGFTDFTYTVRGQLNSYPTLGEISWFRQGDVNLTGTQPISSLNHLANTMNVIFATDRTASAGNPEVYLNNITVEYDRELTATADQLLFGQKDGDVHTFQVTGFGNGVAGETAVWDISNPLAPVAITLTNTDISGSNPYTYTIGRTNGDGTRFIATTNANAQAATVTSYTPPALDPVTGADWIAITPALFASGANQLASHRQDALYGEHSTAVIDIDDIINQYGYGLPLPAAIHDYLAHALTTWPIAPQYVTLVGTGSHSPRGLACADCSHSWTSADVMQYIPTDLLFVDRWQGLIPTDYTYATLIGDDLLPDLAIGRLAVTSTVELTAVINKIIKYEENLHTNPSWINNILFVADNADASGDFPDENDKTAARLPSKYNTTLLEQVPNATVTDTAALRADMSVHINAVNGGVSILNYRGHGSVNRWASPAILDTSVDFWNNNSSPLIILSADCLDGYFAWPDFESLGRDFLTRPLIGSAAHWSSTGLGRTAEHTVLHQAFYDGIFEQDQVRIGDAVSYAKIIYAGSGFMPEGQSELHSFTLQGDPAMNVYYIFDNVYLPLVVK